MTAPPLTSTLFPMSCVLKVGFVPEDPEKWDIDVARASHIASTLKEYRSDVQLYRQLATLRTDVPIIEDLEDLEWNGPRTEELASLCHDIGDDNLMVTVTT